jgi:5-methylcytosine-specific restriction endonuclease McrA
METNIRSTDDLALLIGAFGQNLESISIDQAEQTMICAEAVISLCRSVQIESLSLVDRAQVATADGANSLSEWTARRLDIGLDAARTLVRTMRRTHDRPELRNPLAEGEATFDRIEAVSRISEDVGLMEHLDVGAVRREAGKRAEISAASELRTAADRFLVVQPSLDESWWKLWGGLDGHSGAIVNKVLSEAADQLPPLPDGSRGDSSWRKATALFELCLSDDPQPAQVTVFVDAGQAAPTDARAGVVLEAGPRIGANTLDAILCNAIAEVTVRAEDGRFMEYGRRRRIVPPALKRAILDRDGNTCAGDGCDSRYRIEAHHIIPWSRGGRTDAENLVSLCWFHHHVVVHERGFTVFRHPDHGRIRFRPPDPGTPD